MDPEIRKLMEQLIDQTISSEDFDRLQIEIEQNADLRREYVRLINLTEDLQSLAVEKSLAEPAPAAPVRHRISLWDWRDLAIAASVLLLVGGIAFWVGRQDKSGRDIADNKGNAQQQDPESRIAGHGTLRRSVDLRWSKNVATYREGDVLRAGMLEFTEGIAEIDMFCGASLIVEGPAKLELESDWSVRVIQGRLRTNVPPAARGFVIKAADSEIIDLGTEFALDVSATSARVEVIDGEIKLKGGAHDGNHLVTGEGEWLLGSEPNDQIFKGLSTLTDLTRLRDEAEVKRFAQWQDASKGLELDPRLIAYYPISRSTEKRIVANKASSGSSRDAQLIGPVHRTVGRFGEDSLGLEFDLPGARARTRIDGDFEAFTFTGWVRISSLRNRYNALFMADGYENGEPHWQIRDDGRLMFSVMVDDTQEIVYYTKEDQRFVQDAGLHRVYLTEPFWDISMSGQWVHLAAVYDPAGRKVNQYVNGELFASHEIEDKYFIDTLKIGPAEMGNWGQPFRETPWFAVRNLDGTIDELAIFDAALTSNEIHELYEQGKPLGY